MKIAGKAAKEAGIPIVLDPVGAGGANYRREKTLEIMETVHPDCIRGNLSELRALAMNTSTARGVEAEKEIGIDFGMLRSLSQKWNAIIVASGEKDYVVDGETCVAVSGGSSYMPKVTGTGCMSSTLLGASLAVERSIRSVAACLKAISNCAERAERKTKEADGGTMSFRMYFIDELSKMS